MNSIYFHKEQKQQLHKFIDFVIEYNNTLPYQKHDWLKPLEMKIYEEEGAYIVEFDEPVDCRGFIWIDENHSIWPTSSIWLDIDEDATYTVAMGWDRCNYDIAGQKIMNFIENEYMKENEKLRKEMEVEEKKWKKKQSEQ